MVTLLAIIAGIFGAASRYHLGGLDLLPPEPPFHWLTYGALAVSALVAARPWPMSRLLSLMIMAGLWGIGLLICLRDPWLHGTLGLVPPIAPLTIAAVGIVTLAALDWQLAGQIAFAFATSLLALIFSAIFMGLLAPPVTSPGTPIMISLSVAPPTVFVALAVLLRTRDAVWPWRDQDDRISRIGLFITPPIATLFIIILTVTRRYAVDSGLMGALGADRFAGLALMLAITALTLWMVRTLNWQQRRLLESYAATTSADTMVITEHGIVERWSDGCAHIYGFTAAEAIGRDRYALTGARLNGEPAGLPPHNSERHSRLLEENAKDGTDLKVIEVAQRFISSRGEQLLSVAVTNVTAQWVREQSLRDRYLRLELALDQPRYGAFDWDAENGLTAWTITDQDQIGLPQGYVDSLDRLRSITHPDDAERITEQFAQASTFQHPHLSFSYRILTPTGVERVLKGVARCEYSPTGEIVRVFGANVDITERVGAEHAVRIGEFSGLPDDGDSMIATVMVDHNGRIILFNVSAETIFGYSESEVVGRDITYLLSPDGENLPEKVLADAIAGGRQEVSVRHRDGSSMVLEIWAQHIEMSGEPKYVLFIRDLGALMRSEERLSDARGEILRAASLRTVEEVAAGMAHEINQPLAAMVNHLAVARILLERMGDGVEPNILESVRSASTQALRAGAIIKRLNQFVRIGEPDVAPVSLPAAVREAVAMKLVGNFQDKVAIDIHVPSGSPRVLADRVQLQQVLLNILRNALEALRTAGTESPHIVIATHLGDDGMMHVSLADNGPGLPDTVLANICTPFFSTKRSGMGVGLSISRRIVEAHGGRLTAYRGANGGAVFEFTLPVVNEEHFGQ